MRALGHLLRGLPPSPGLDWEAIEDLARQHGVAPLLCWRLNRTETWRDSIPEEVKQRLQEALYLAAVRAMVAEQQLAEILKALSLSGVSALVLKGAAVGAFYPDPALRAYGDLDLLVPEEQLDRAEQALKGLGYRGSEQKQWWLDRHFHLPPMFRNGSCLAVEIHWQLDGLRRMGILPIEDLWARAAPWSVEGQPTMRLDTVDSALYICRHAVVQHLARLGLRPVCDLVQVVGGWEQTEWEVLTRRALDYRLGRATLFVLTLAEQLLALDVPPGVIEKLCPSSHVSLPADLIDRFLTLEAGSTAHMPTTAIRSWAQGTYSARLRYLLQHLYLSRDGMAAFYNVPDNSLRIWSTYLWHPIGLLRRYRRAVWGLVRGDRASRSAWAREAWLQRWLSADERVEGRRSAAEQ